MGPDRHRSWLELAAAAFDLVRMAKLETAAAKEQCARRSPRRAGNDQPGGTDGADADAPGGLATTDGPTGLFFSGLLGWPHFEGGDLVQVIRQASTAGASDADERRRWAQARSTPTDV